MATNLSLRSLLDSDKLNGSNFNSWFRKLKIILEHERILYILNNPAPKVPDANTQSSDKDTYQKWLNDRTSVRCIMLAAMNDEFGRRFENAQPEEIIQALNESFGTPDDVERHKTSCAIFNARMRDGSPVTDHVLYMIEKIELLSKLGFPLHEQLGKDAILNSLPPSFRPFLTHFRMTKPAVNYHGLLGLLQNFEKDNQLSKGLVNVVDGSKVGHQPFGKGKKKKNKKKVQHARTSKRGQMLKKKVDKSQAECFHCKMQGHWKRNCPLYIATLDPNRPKKKKGQDVAPQGIYMITPCNFSVYDNLTWVLDTGSPFNICNSLQGLQVTKRFEDNERFLNVGDGRLVPVLALGVLEIVFNRNVILLNDCHYCPTFLLNVISVGLLATSNYEISIKDVTLNIIMNGVIVMTGHLSNGIYILSQPVNVVYNSSKRPRTTDVTDIYIWHHRLGHINKNRLNRLTQEGILRVDDCESLKTCESCLLGKMTKSSFTRKGERAKELLGLVHTDVCGPMSTCAKGGYYYFITFTDDLSRFGYVYLMRHKSESFEMFKQYHKEVEKQTGKCIKILRSDRGGEYLSNDFVTYLRENGILSQWTPPGTPQHNGVSERRNRTLLDMVRSMMGFASLSISFWGYALESACHILNKVPSKSVSKTPHEMWYGHKPVITYLRVWGCPAYVKRAKSDKLEPKSDKCFFIGYPKETKGYYFYNTEEQKVFISNRAVFLEKEFLSEGTNSSNIELEEVHQVEGTTQTSEHLESELIRSNSKPILNAPLRRSGRVPNQPDRYLGFLVQNGDPVELDENNEDPITYMDAMQRTDSNKWLDAMKSELDSMKDNNVWTLVDPPEGIKPIGCKWVFKRKRGADGKVETYKARLVAKGYRQRYGIDYDETFSPVAMLKSIRIMLAIAAHFDYEI